MERNMWKTGRKGKKRRTPMCCTPETPSETENFSCRHQEGLPQLSKKEKLRKSPIIAQSLESKARQQTVYEGEEGRCLTKTA